MPFWNIDLKKYVIEIYMRINGENSSDTGRTQWSNGICGLKIHETVKS